MNPTTVLFGFDLLSPSILGWAAVAVAPLLIHLWSRRRYQEMPWAAMRYLLAAMKAARRRTRLEQWLLLLVRTLIILVVVFAAAEPFFDLGSVPFVPGVRAYRVFLLDGSFSMDYRPESTSRFEAAKALIARVVDESNQGDGFSLVLMSAPARVMVDEPSFSTRDFLAELEEIRQPHTGADLAGAVARVERLLAEAKRTQTKLSRQEVYVLTDLGRVGWSTAGMDRSESETIRRRFRKIGEETPITVIDLGQGDADNVAVTDLRTGQVVATRGRTLDIRAEIQSYSRSSTLRRVQLLADGRRVAEEQVTLEPDGSASVAFSHRFETSGDHTLEVIAAGDRLEVDNSRRLALTVKPALRVLCIDGQPAGAFGAASDFLTFALSPDAGQGAAATIRPEVAGESALVEFDLHQYDCVFLVNVAQFTNSEARVLESYLKGGGGVIFFLGDRVMADRYNRVLGSATPDSLDLLPARLAGEPVEERRLIDPLEYRHPIVEVFRGQERAGLLTTPIQKFYPLSVPEESAGSVVLALDDGTPLVVEHPVHRGRVILVGTSADVSWTPMPVLPSYVPVVQEMLAYSVADQQQRRNVLVGESIGATLTRTGAATSITVETPDGRSEAAPLALSAGVGSWDFSATDPSGVYTASVGAGAEQKESFAVNVETSESDLAKISEAELRQGVLGDVEFQLRTDWQRMSAEPAGVTTRPNSLAKMLLYLLLALLLTETYLARRFGHHTS